MHITHAASTVQADRHEDSQGTPDGGKERARSLNHCDARLAAFSRRVCSTRVGSTQFFSFPKTLSSPLLRLFTPLVPKTTGRSPCRLHTTRLSAARSPIDRHWMSNCR